MIILSNIQTNTTITRKYETKDNKQVICIKDDDGKVLVIEQNMKSR